MFTGVTEELGKISVIQRDKLTVIARKVLEGTKIDDSIAVNGICLTVVRCDASSFTVDVMPETTKRTTFGQWRVGDEVNLERALTFAGRVGGHLVQGHIDGAGKIIGIREAGDDYIVRIETSREMLRYVVLKGFVAVDGVSLTVTEKQSNYFEISLIKHTKSVTTFAKRKVGDMVNLEVDIIGKYVEALIRSPEKTIDTNFLQEHGFLVK